MDDLIFDRLASDVDNALNNPGSSSYLKGSYNHTDLNRVEEWCGYLAERLRPYGFSETLNIKTDWTIRDYPKKTEMDRIRTNIDKLKEFCISVNPGTILYNDTLDYEQANLMERILYEIYISLIEMNVTIELGANIGATSVEKDYIHVGLQGTIQEIETVDAEMKIGATTVTMDYMSLIVSERIEERTEISSNLFIGTAFVEKDYIFLKEED